MPSYAQDKGLESLANTIIKVHRAKLEHLKICYIFRDEAPISGDKVIAGRCIRVDDRNWTVHKFDFIIEIAKDVWEQATDDFKRALMDHELGHIAMELTAEGGPVRDERNGRLKTRCKMHDIEEFEEVLERHGAYHKKLREFLDAFARHKKKKRKTDESEEDPEE